MPPSDGGGMVAAREETRARLVATLGSRETTPDTWLKSGPCFTAPAGVEARPTANGTMTATATAATRYRRILHLRGEGGERPVRPRPAVLRHWLESEHHPLPVVQTSAP